MDLAGLLVMQRNMIQMMLENGMEEVPGIIRPCLISKDIL